MSGTTLADYGECPDCFMRITAATAVGHDHLPSKSAITVCAHCGAILQFDEKVALERMDEAQLATLPADQLEQLQRMSAFFKAQKASGKVVRIITKEDFMRAYQAESQKTRKPEKKGRI